METKRRNVEQVQEGERRPIGFSIVVVATKSSRRSQEGEHHKFNDAAVPATPAASSPAGAGTSVRPSLLPLDRKHSCTPRSGGFVSDLFDFDPSSTLVPDLELSDLVYWFIRVRLRAGARDRITAAYVLRP